MIFSFSSFASLAALTLIPVQHRMTFEAGLGLAWTVFIGAFMNAFVPYFIGLDVSQQFIRNKTESIRLKKASNVTSSTTLLEIGAGEL